MKNYTNIYYQPGEEPVFSYRSKLLVYEETFAENMIVSSGYNTAGFPLNVLSNYPTGIDRDRLREPSSFNLEINGRNVDNAWNFADFRDEETENGHRGIITLKNTAFKITAKVYTILDGTQMLSRYIAFTNHSDKPLSISRLSLIAGACESMEKAKIAKTGDPGGLYDWGYFDGDRWGREGEFNWHRVSPDSHSFEAKYGRDRFRHPAMFIRNNITGTMFFAQAAWTGGCRFSLDLNASAGGDSTLLSIRIELSGYKPLYVLMPGETLTTPEALFGMITGGLDEAVNEMHAHVRKSLLNRPEARGDALLVGCGMGPEHDMSVETSKAFMRQMQEMGGEVFIIDAGWQCPPGAEPRWYDDNGGNIPDPDRYPAGIGELREYAASLGMKFGMWMEPERVGKNTRVFREHPEWFPTRYRGGKNAGFIDLTIPEAAKWVEEEIARVIREYRLDLFRLDHNGAPDYFCVGDVKGTGIGECKNIRLINAVYRMYGNLKKRFPEVIFENCASGGGRTDLGMIKAFNHTWVSDWQRLPRSVTITSGMTMVIPPERVDRLFAGMGSHEIGSLALNMRNAMLGHMTLNVISPATAEINSEAMDFVKRSVSVYKEFIRKFLPDCRIYHHTPEAYRALEEGYAATEIVSEDRSRAAIHAATLTAPNRQVYNVFPRGLDRSKTYKVTLDNSGEMFTVSGHVLMNDGLRLRIPAALMSELILIEEV
ncbi:MAG: alpha-galactosidase [Christensenellales bacterium]|jgi:alpha-galactosidase